MTRFRKYFCRHASETLVRFAILAVIVVCYSFVYDPVKYGYVFAGTDMFGYPQYAFAFNYINTPVTVAMIIAALELAPLKKRTNLDRLFSIPIGRTALALAHFVNGALQITALLALNMLVAFLRVVKYYGQIEMRYMIVQLFFTLLLTLALYAISMFSFDRANNIVDGVIFIIFGSMIAMPIVGLINLFADLDKVLFDSLDYIPAALSYSLDRSFSKAFNGDGFELYPEVLNPFIAFLVLGVAATVGYFCLFKRCKSEDVGGISDRLIGYKIGIPLYSYWLLLLIDSTSMIATIILVLVSMLVGYIVFRRGVRFGRSDIVMMSLALAWVLLGFIF